MLIKMPINKEQFEDIQESFREAAKTDFYSTSPYASSRTYHYLYSYKDKETIFNIK